MSAKKPTNYDQLFPGRFLKAGLFEGKDVTLTIGDFDAEEMPTDDGGKEVKGIISFRETPKMLALCRTNGEALKAMFGNALAKWVGKRVTLFPTQVKFGPDTVDAIRVRGSPDLERDITFSLRLARKKPRKETLKKTDGKATAAPAEDPHAPPDDVPGFEPDTSG